MYKEEWFKPSFVSCGVTNPCNQDQRLKQWVLIITKYKDQARTYREHYLQT